jgi:hypothetical protein
MDQQSQQKLGPPDDGAFDEMLRSTKVEVPLPGAFQAEVWRRIAVHEDSAPLVRLTLALKPVLSLFNRPLAASASVLLTVLVGLWLGSLEAHPARDGKLDYVESISPFAQSHQQ